MLSQGVPGQKGDAASLADEAERQMPRRDASSHYGDRTSGAVSSIHDLPERKRWTEEMVHSLGPDPFPGPFPLIESRGFGSGGQEEVAGAKGASIGMHLEAPLD